MPPLHAAACLLASLHTYLYTVLGYGPAVHTTASTVLAGTRIQERTRSTNSELEGRSQQRPTLRKMGFTWEEAEVAALDRHGCHRSVAQCVQFKGIKGTSTIRPGF